MIARKLAFATLLCSGLLVASVASAQFTLTHDAVTGPVGGQVTGTVTLDNSFGDVQGWSFGVCVDPAIVSVSAVASGSTTQTVKNGGAPDFLATNEAPMPGTGWTMGVVIDFFSVFALGIGTGYEVATADYDLLAAGTSPADFCDTLGTPPVETLIVVSGGSMIPTQTSGSITATVAAGVDFFANDATLEFSGSSTVSPAVVNITMDNPNDAIQGYSFGLTSNTTELELTDINITGTVAEASNGGMGPAFFAPTLNPVGGGGGTLGVVVSLQPPFDEILTGTGQSIANFVYDLAAGHAPMDGDTTPIGFSSTLGDPMVAVVAVVGGNTVDPGTTDGLVTFEEQMVQPTNSFIRGDANNDAIVNIADGVWIINFLWLGGPASDCEIAGDANGSGGVDTSDAMYIFMWRLQGGPAPTGAFFPGCESAQPMEPCAVTASMCP